MVFIFNYGLKSILGTKSNERIVFEWWKESKLLWLLVLLKHWVIQNLSVCKIRKFYWITEFGARLCFLCLYTFNIALLPTDFSLSQWKVENYVSGALEPYQISELLEMLNLQPYMKSSSCSRQQPVYSSAGPNGWQNGRFMYHFLSYR